MSIEAHITAVAARLHSGAIAVFRLEEGSAFDLEETRSDVKRLITQQKPFRPPQVVLVGIKGGKA